MTHGLEYLFGDDANGLRVDIHVDIQRAAASQRAQDLNQRVEETKTPRYQDYVWGPIEAVRDLLDQWAVNLDKLAERGGLPTSQDFFLDLMAATKNLRRVLEVMIAARDRDSGAS